MPTETITGDRNKKTPHVYRFWPASTHIASSVPAESSHQQPQCKRHGLQWLICHMRDEPHCRAILTWCCMQLCFRTVTGVTFQLWMPALHLCAVSKDSSDFGLQPSQCLQNFPVKKRDTVHQVILLLISYSTFFVLTHMASTPPTVF